MLLTCVRGQHGIGPPSHLGWGKVSLFTAVYSRLAYLLLRFSLPPSPCRRAGITESTVPVDSGDSNSGPQVKCFTAGPYPFPHQQGWFSCFFNWSSLSQSLDNLGRLEKLDSPIFVVAHTQKLKNQPQIKIPFIRCILCMNFLSE